MVVFMGLIKDLFPQEFDTMPRSRDEAFEALVAEAALEERLQPEAYFVQNVVDLQAYIGLGLGSTCRHATCICVYIVDLQDLLDIRHCVFTLGESGANKSL